MEKGGRRGIMALGGVGFGGRRGVVHGWSMVKRSGQIQLFLEKSDSDIRSRHLMYGWKVQIRNL